MGVNDGDFDCGFYLVFNRLVIFFFVPAEFSALCTVIVFF